jgi:hypothetical protein
MARRGTDVDTPFQKPRHDPATEEAGCAEHCDNISIILVDHFALKASWCNGASPVALFASELPASAASPRLCET